MNMNFLKLHKNNDPVIDKYRTCNAVITITDSGKPLANAEIEISQIGHKFFFGTNGFHTLSIPNDSLYSIMSHGEKSLTESIADKMLDLFNLITLPFYWGRFEEKQGSPITDIILNSARWLNEKGCKVKGHPLCWHTLSPDWLLAMSEEDILSTQLERITREVTNFKGIIDIWDVVNEAVIMPIFDKYDNGITRICKKYGRIQTIKKTFDAARKSNPNATLLLNDFDLSTAYEILIEGCLESGIKIDVIGLQTHMHQGFMGIEKLEHILETYSRFDLPLHFTEATIISGDLMPSHIVDLNDFQVDDWPSTSEGEERQAEEVVSFYKTLFSHPKVEAITWWDIKDGAWLKAPSGLIRKDASPKPAYNELMKLIKDEWWCKPAGLKTDSQGRIFINGFLGNYKIAINDRHSSFILDKAGETPLSLSV